jgi:hypothetical protein
MYRILIAPGGEQGIGILARDAARQRKLHQGRLDFLQRLLRPVCSHLDIDRETAQDRIAGALRRSGKRLRSGTRFLQQQLGFRVIALLK